MIPLVNGEDGLPLPRRLLAILTMACAVTLSGLGTSIVNLALPEIARDLGASPSGSTWLVSGYQLAMAVCLLPFAALGEIHGYRRVYLAGLVVFLIASTGAALSGSLAALVVWRIAQGVGAAGILSVNIAILRFVYPAAQLGRGIGVNAVIAGVSMTAGPPVGALLLELGGWPLLFVVNVPLGSAALLLALRSVPRTPLAAHRFDLGGGACSAGMLGLFLTAANGLAHGYPAWLTVGALALSAAAGARLLLRRQGVAPPVMPLDLLRIPLFRLSVLTSVLSFAAQMLALVVLPFHLERLTGMNAARLGIELAIWPACTMAIAVVAGHLADRFSAAILGTAGLAVLAAGLLALAGMTAETGTVGIAWRMALCGLGFGLFQSPNNRVLMATAPRARSGAASGMLGTARLVGQSLGGTLAAVALAAPVALALEISLALGAAIALCAALASASRLTMRHAAPKQASAAAVTEAGIGGAEQRSSP